MKTKIFTSTVTLFLFTVLIFSCSSSKSTTKQYPQEQSTKKYPGSSPTENSRTNPANLPPGQAKKVYGTKSAKVFAPGQQKKHNKHYPLIVLRTPDIIILRHADGRYFYKNEDNYIYWQGSDDRFYLDGQYLDKVDYDKNELENWKNKGNGKENDQKKIPPGQAKKDEANEQYGNGNGKGKGNSKKN